MKLLDVITAPWAIEPAKLLEIQAIYATHLRGEKIDVAAVEARIGRSLANEPKPYQVVDGVAIVGLEGVIAKRANLFSQISGGTSSQIVAREVQAALADDAVHSIILAIDSPGGTVDGTQALAQIVRGGKASKPIVALADGTIASAAYWIGSAAEAIYITDGTTNVGSIGVIATHTEVSKAQAAAGVKTTEVVAGKFKNVASQFAPLTKEGRQAIQDAVDYTYSLFVADVAQHRGVSAEKVLNDMADGRVFMGQQAIDAGLVDGVSTLDALIARLSQERGKRSTSPRRAGAALQGPTQGIATMPMTREELAAQAPDLLAAVLAEGHAAGAAAECARIKDVEAQALPGHEALIAGLKFDGKTSGAEAAVAVLAAERTALATRAKHLAGDAPSPVKTGAAPSVELPSDKDGMSRADLDAKAKAHMAAHPGCDYVTAVKFIEANQGA
jgi:capsid assembly protease